MLALARRRPLQSGWWPAVRGVSASGVGAPAGRHDVFRCPGIDEPALLMRRGCQAAFGIELVGTTLAKACFHSINLANFLSAPEQALSNANFVMFLRFGVIWWYQGYTRDHLVARHVTRLSLERPLAETPPGVPLVVYLETGPWTRRLEFRSAPRDHVVPFAQLIQLGAIHFDEVNGEVLDRGALDLLSSGQLHIVAEELFVDEEAKRRAFIGEYQVPDLLQDDSSGANRWWAELPPVLLRPLSWRSSLAFYNAAALMLTMGVGSVLQWLPHGALPLPECVDRVFYPRTRSFEY